MTRYRITLQICSSLITPLKGDTIWGHIAWGIANHEGEEGIAAFLQEEKTDTPSLVVSSAFPTGMICRPLPEPQKRTENLTAQKYSEIKENKKKKYESGGTYFQGIPQTNDWEKAPFETRQVLHNKIDRETNTVMEGGLYAIQEYWPKIQEWDVYIISSYDEKRIVELFEWAFEYGYGADASVGRGNIRVKEKSICSVSPKNKGNTYMTLGPFVQNLDKLPADVRGDLFIRTGKIGGAFAPFLSPYKKTVLLYDEGTVFTSEKPLLYAGRLLEHIHQDPRICQSAFAPVIPIT